MADLTDIVLPADQTEGTTNMVGKWFKRVGDPVSTNDPLLEITTDKVTVEISAPASGVLVEIVRQEGEEVVPGAVLGRIGAGILATAAAAAQPTRGRTPELTPATGPDGVEGELSPAVRRKLKEHGLEPGQVKGTGRGGRITLEDVELVLATRPSPLATGQRTVPHSQMRKSIAAHMVRSMATAPHVTTVFDADLSAVIAHREAKKASFGARGVNLTYTAYFVRATVAALQAVPEVNSRWHDDSLEIFDDVNIGVATALEAGGLIVPVIHQAQALDLFETARRLQDLTTRARAGKLEPKDVQGGTFTISNHGVSGSLVAAPVVINQPQSAILGVGKLEKRAVVDQRDEVVVKPMVYVTLTIDHRVLDGFQANAFLTKWVAAIRSP